MTPFRFTLRSDGTSDAVLLPVVEWVLAQHLPNVPLDGQLAVPRDLGRKVDDLADHLALAFKMFPCDLLVVHRDAEKQSPVDRIAEVLEAVAKVGTLPKHVCVVPIRMSEAWMLFDEAAIRAAAGNPNGKCELRLPRLAKVEDMADPKSDLFAALKTAFDQKGRRLREFNYRAAARKVAGFIDDFSPLRVLSAFQAFEADIESFAKTWSPPEQLPPEAHP